MAEPEFQHRAGFKTKCVEYLHLFRNAPLVAKGVAVYQRHGRPFGSRNNYAEFRTNTVVVYRSEEIVSREEVGPEDIISIFNVFNCDIRLERSEKEARIYFKRKETGADKNIMFVQISPDELEEWKAGLERALARRIPSLSDIRVLRCIGKGGFGKVFLVKLLESPRKQAPSPTSISCSSTQMFDDYQYTEKNAISCVGESPYYALKVVPKVPVFKSRTALHHIITERNLLESLRGPYFLPLSFAFQTATNFYFGTPLCPGGDLGSYLKRRGIVHVEFPSIGDCESVGTLRGLPENIVRAVSAQIVVGLAHMHKKGVLHRDLKPDNLLIEATGNLRFADFGLSRVLPTGTHGQTGERSDDSPSPRSRLKQRANTKCGTKYFKAPEIGQGEYSFPADIWSFGVLLYNLFTGKLPFSPCEYHRMKDKREDCAHVKTLILPDCISKSAKSLLTKILQHQPEKRLTISQIRRHRFYRQIQWNAVEKAQGPTALPDVLFGIDISDAKACCEFALRAAELMPCSNEILKDDGDASDTGSFESGDAEWSLIGFEYGTEELEVEPLEVSFRKSFPWRARAW